MHSLDLLGCIVIVPILFVDQFPFLASFVFYSWLPLVGYFIYKQIKK